MLKRSRRFRFMRWFLLSASTALVIFLSVWGRPMAVWLLGPPQVELREQHAVFPARITLDHQLWAQVLSEIVQEHSVDYERLIADTARLDHYIQQLAELSWNELNRDQKLAVGINAYNAWTLRLICDYCPLNSIRDIPTAQRWKDQRWTLAGRLLSLHQLEHDILRAEFADARIHFAINCASISCPPLLAQPFTAGNLDDQLQLATTAAHQHQLWFQYDEGSHTIVLSALYEWYAHDVRQDAGSVITFVARYRPELQVEKPKPSIRYLPYNWSLNTTHP